MSPEGHPMPGDAVVELDHLGQTVELWIVAAVNLHHGGVQITKVRRAGSSRVVDPPRWTAIRQPVAERTWRTQ